MKRRCFSRNARRKFRFASVSLTLLLAFTIALSLWISTAADTTDPILPEATSAEEPAPVETPPNAPEANEKELGPSPAPFYDGGGNTPKPETGGETAPSPRPEDPDTGPESGEENEEDGEGESETEAIEKDKNTDESDEDDESSETGPEGETDGEEDSEEQPNHKYPSGWAESKQPYLRGNLALAGMMKELEDQLAREISRMKDVFNLPKSTRIEYEKDNFCDILAVYAALNNQTKGFPYGVKMPTAASKRQLTKIYWDMTKPGFREYEDENDAACVIEVSRLTYADVAEQYGLKDQQTLLASLTTDKMRREVKTVRDGSILSRISFDEFKAIRKRVPGGISDMRRAVLTAALSLESKVTYFWSGKSYHVGWDERWGQMRVVTAEGSSMSGTARPMGLDCSGFVCWSFINATGDRETYSKIGRSAASQWGKSFPIKWSEAQPGDLVFCDVPGEADYDHVGIIVSIDESGNVRIVHCSSSRNGVIVTGKETFKYARRPYIYGE